VWCDVQGFGMSWVNQFKRVAFRRAEGDGGHVIALFRYIYEWTYDKRLRHALCKPVLICCPTEVGNGNAE
jgi:hypothetical protein